MPVVSKPPWPTQSPLPSSIPPRPPLLVLSTFCPPRSLQSSLPHLFPTFPPSLPLLPGRRVGPHETRKIRRGMRFSAKAGFSTRPRSWDGRSRAKIRALELAMLEKMKALGPKREKRRGRGILPTSNLPRKGNLPYDVDSGKLALLFEKAGTVRSLSTVEEAEKAVEMFHRYELDGRLLTVNRANPRGSKPDSFPSVFDSGFRVYAGNMPWTVDSARLEQVFSEHGKVLNARVVYDRDSFRSRGFGFVTMTSETEMNAAIAALDGQNLDGRAIEVNVAEERPREKNASVYVKGDGTRLFCWAQAKVRQVRPSAVTYEGYAIAEAERSTNLHAPPIRLV